MSDEQRHAVSPILLSFREHYEGRTGYLPDNQIRYLLSLRFWSVHDGVRRAFGVLDRRESLPQFDFIDAMDDATEGEVYWGVTAGKIKEVTELAEEEWMTDRSTPDEWIAFFKRHSLPGAEIFKRGGEGESAKPAESAPSEVDRSDFQEQAIPQRDRFAETRTEERDESWFVEHVKEQFWGTAERENRSTWPTGDVIKKYLKGGFDLAEAQVKRIDVAARPKWAKRGGRPPSNAEKG